MNPSLISAINRSRNGSRDKGCFLGISLAVSTTYQISISRRVLQNEYHPKIPSLLFPPHLPFRRQQVFAFLPVCCHFPVHLYKRKPSYLWHQGNDMANFVVFTMESPPPLQMVFKHVDLKSHSAFNFNQSEYSILTKWTMFLVSSSAVLWITSRLLSDPSLVPEEI